MKEMDLIPEKQPRGHPRFPERQVGLREPGETGARRFRWAEDVVKRIFPKTERGKTDLSSLSPDFRATVDAFRTLTDRELTQEKLVEENERLRNLRRESKISDQEGEYLEKLTRSISGKMARLEGHEEPQPGREARRAEIQGHPPARPTQEAEQAPPIRGDEVAPAPDVDPIEWYLDQLARARATRTDVDAQKQRVGELLRRARNEEERQRYSELLDTPGPEEDRGLADKVFIDDLIKTKEQITIWETDPAWSQENREKAKLVREVIAPIVEYRESWGDAIQKAEEKITGLERGQFDTVRDFFAVARRTAVSFQDLTVEERLDGRKITAGQLRMPDGVDVARIDAVQNISPEARTQLQQIKEGYQRDFGESAQPLEEIRVSHLPREKAEQAVRKYFDKTMLYCESRKWFPSGETEARFREFLRNIDPRLDSLYGDSKWFINWFKDFETGTPVKIRDTEENIDQVENMISLVKRIPGASEAINYTQALDEYRYCEDKIRIIRENIQQNLNHSTLPTVAQRQRIENKIATYDNSGRLISGLEFERQLRAQELPELKRFFEQAVDGDEVTRARVLIFAERFRRSSGLAAAASIYRPEVGPADDPILKLFQYDERALIIKRYRNVLRFIGTGFEDVFGGNPYHFWEQYGKVIIRRDIETILARNDQVIKEDFGLNRLNDVDFNRLLTSYDRRTGRISSDLWRQTRIDWARVNWEKLETNVGWEFELAGEKYEGKPIEIGQLLIPWADDLADADDARREVDKLLDKETITVEDVQAVKGKFKYLFAPIQRRIERFYASLADSFSQSVILEMREQTGESIFTNESAAQNIRKLLLQGVFERDHFETYLSFIPGPDGFPKYANFSELAKNPLTLKEGALMILNLLGGDVRVGNVTIARGRELVEAFLNRNEETGELVEINNRITFEEFAAYAGLVIENQKLRQAGVVDEIKLNELGVDAANIPNVLDMIRNRGDVSRGELRSRLNNVGLNNGQIAEILRILYDELRADGTAYLGVDQQGRRLRLKDAARDRIIKVLQNRLGHGFGDRCSKITTWMDIQEHILSKGAKLFLGLDFVPGEELEQTLQRYYLLIEHVVPQLGHREVGVGLNENEPITQSLIDGADPMTRLLRGNWFEWRDYTAEERAATKRLLPLRLHWDPKLTVQEAWIELGPTMLEGRVEQSWTKNPTPQDWREVLEQLERPEAFNQINKRQRELLESQFNCLERNVVYQSLGRALLNIPNEKGELVKDKYFEPIRKGITALLPGWTKVIGGTVIPKILPPGWETVTQFGLAITGGILGSLAGPGGAFLGIISGWMAGNDWDRRSHWFPAGWGRWLLSRSWARRNTYPGTGITIGVWDWPYNSADLAKIFGEKKKNYS